MRTYALVIAAAALFTFPALVFSQGIEVPGVEIGPGGVRVVHPIAGFRTRNVRNCGARAFTRRN